MRAGSEWAAAERVRVAVGRVGDAALRSFAIKKRGGARAALVAVVLERPLGIVLAYDDSRKIATVAELVPGSGAARRAAQASLDGAAAARAALPGDVLRAVTATNFVYTSRALLGAAAPERHIVLYGADGQRWDSISNALRKGEARDGSVTLIFERNRVEALHEGQQGVALHGLGGAGGVGVS